MSEELITISGMLSRMREEDRGYSRGGVKDTSDDSGLNKKDSSV